METLPKARPMHDIALAQSLLQTTWPTRSGRPAKICIDEIVRAVRKIERALPDEVRRLRPRQWTERRVRAIWDGEARRIDNYEMVDLEKAALEAAIHEHQIAVSRTKRLADFIAAYDPTDHRSLAGRVREFVGGVGGAGA